MVSVANDKIHTSKRTLRVWKTICPRVPDSLSMLKDLPGEVCEDVNKRDFLIQYHEMRRHSEGQCSSRVTLENG